MTKQALITPVQVELMCQKLKTSKNLQALRDLALIRMLYCCGPTLTELAQLKIGDVFSDSGEVRTFVDTKQFIVNEAVSKTIHLFDPDLIESLAQYKRLRLAHCPYFELVSGEFSQAKLFVNDKGEGFTRVRTNTTSAKSYHSYQSLSSLIRSIHARAGIEGGNAESARRSWTFWLYYGLDGRLPVPPELLMELRGDARLSGTLAACGISPKDRVRAAQLQLQQFMTYRGKVKPIPVVGQMAA